MRSCFLTSHRLPSFALAGALILSSAGCGSSGRVPIEGRATYQGQPLANATLTFFPATGRPVLASVANGEYHTELLPGDYTVAVTLAPEMPQGYGRTHWNQLPPQAVELPVEYTSRATSKLKTTVTRDLAEPVSFNLQ